MNPQNAPCWQFLQQWLMDDHVPSPTHLNLHYDSMKNKLLAEVSETLKDIMYVIKLPKHTNEHLSASCCCHAPSKVFQTCTNETEQSRWLTIAGCLLLRARLALGKAGERAPRPPLCTADSRLCMSEWAPSKPWPTAWLRSTWMASSKRSSILLCYMNIRNLHLDFNMTKYTKLLINAQFNDFNSAFVLYCALN